MLVQLVYVEPYLYTSVGMISYHHQTANCAAKHQYLTPSSEVSNCTASAKRPSLIAVYTIVVYWPSGTMPLVDIVAEGIRRVVCCAEECVCPLVAP